MRSPCSETRKVQFEGKVVAITGASGGNRPRALPLFRRRGRDDRGFRPEPCRRSVRWTSYGRRASRLTQLLSMSAGHADAVKHAFSRVQSALGDAEILINNAGVSHNPALGRTTPEGWADDVNANLNGAYNCAYAVLPSMQARKKGVIVNIGSVNGFSALGDAAYSAGKAGMVSLTRSLAQEFGRYNIRVNIVCPGTVRTPIWDERSKRNPEVLEQLTRWYPLGRIVEPIEVMRAVAFLASDAASAITGVALPVDCGLDGRQHRDGARAYRRRPVTFGGDAFGQAAYRRHRSRMVRRDPLRGAHRHRQHRARGALHAHRKPPRRPRQEIRGEEDLCRLSQECSPIPTSTPSSIVTMWDQHTEPTLAALKAGKHVFLEKPITSTVADARKIIEASKGAKGILQVGHICRFNPRYRAAKEAIDAGRIGKIVSLSLAPQHSGRVDTDDPEQDRPDRRRRDPRHRPDALVHRRPGGQRLRPDGRRARPETSRHRLDHVPLRRRRHGDARERSGACRTRRLTISTSA